MRSLNMISKINQNSPEDHVMTVHDDIEKSDDWTKEKVNDDEDKPDVEHMAKVWGYQLAYSYALEVGFPTNCFIIKCSQGDEHRIYLRLCVKYMQCLV